MTYEQYWYGDALMVRAYRKAYEIQQQRVNAELHLQGRYIYDALCCVAPVLHAFAKKGTKPIKYPDKPYSAKGDEDTSITEEEKKRIAENERLKAILFFRNWERAVNANINEGR